MSTPMFLSRLALIILFIALWRHYILSWLKERAVDGEAVEKRWMYFWTAVTMLLSA